MPFKKVRGVDVYYSFRKRKSPVVVFIHGAGGNHLNWFYQIEYLPFTTIALDLPGHGNSKGEPLDNIEDYANFIRQFLDNFSEEYIIVGHSMGGHISLKLTSTKVKVKGVALISSTSKLPHLSPPADPENFCNNMFYSRKHFERCLKTADKILKRKEIFSKDLKAARESDVSDVLNKIRMPVLFIFGTKDRILNNEEIKRSLTLPKRYRAHFVTAGHMVMIEKFERVNRILEEWIRTISKKVLNNPLS